MGTLIETKDFYTDTSVILGKHAGCLTHLKIEKTVWKKDPNNPRYTYELYAGKLLVFLFFMERKVDGRSKAVARCRPNIEMMSFVRKRFWEKEFSISLEDFCITLNKAGIPLRPLVQACLFDLGWEIPDKWLRQAGEYDG